MKYVSYCNRRLQLSTSHTAEQSGEKENYEGVKSAFFHCCDSNVELDNKNAIAMS